MGGDGEIRLAMRGVSKRYGSVRALDGVGLELQRGEVLALLGENGAGKSTLVKILAGLVKPDAGSIEVDSVPVELYPSRRSQAAGIAVVQQESSLVPTMSSAENLVLGQAGAGAFRAPGRVRRRARVALERVGLEHVDPAAPVENLGVAERQLLELARATARQAQIMVLDEPTAALSDAEVERVLRLVKRLAADGCCVVYVTHRLPEVFRIADRVVVVRNGRALDPVVSTEVTPDGLVRMMLGRELTTMYPTRADDRGAPVLDVDGLLVAGLREPVSLRVRSGEILGLTGQLGSGADAVVRGLAGTLPIHGGTASLDGGPLSLANRGAGIRAGIAYCSADRKRDGIFADVAVRENLSSPWLSAIATRGWISRQREQRRAREVAEIFQVDVRRLSTKVGALSGGNQQKVALGKWLGTDPRVLLVEEPTRGVDVGARAEIYRHLRRLCDGGMAVIMASSDTAEIYGVSDTIATFYRGHMSAVRAREEWDEASVVHAVMHREVAA